MADQQKRPRDAPTPGAMDRKDAPPMSSKETRHRAPERGRKVAAARKRAGMTQGDLAASVGVARASINRIERGDVSPNVTLALAIAHELGESVETLFGGGR